MNGAKVRAFAVATKKITLHLLCIFHANYLQSFTTLCKLFANSLSPDAQYEIVPFLGAALASKHLLIESAADGTDGAHVATQHSGDVLGGDAKFDELIG